MVLIESIQTAVQQTGLNITLHAQKQMTSRHIRVSEAREALLSADAQVIEDYPDDPRGPSCLVYGRALDRELHVHVSYPPDVVVITAYEPDPARWQVDLKTRK